MRIPTATYRLQCNASFGFAHARELVSYLTRLGVSDLYTSPIVAARPGSGHGYDVIDPTRLNPDLGSETDFEALVDELHERDMGLLLDIVPNHMAATPDNAWWADVLRHGPSSPYATYFDIDWTAGDGKLVLPILGRPYREALEAGELVLERDGAGLAVRYYDTRLPVDPRSYVSEAGSLDEMVAALNADRDALGRLLSAQHYRLADWRTGEGEINYRRFFDITRLAGVRVEDPAVFDATHDLILELAREGKVTGLRIDHIDGLSDPAAYVERLQERLGGDAYLLVEKILTGPELLPAGWPVAGTTGYDFLNLVNGLFVDPSGLDALSTAYAGFTGLDAGFADVVYEQKRRVIRALFQAELRSLVRQLRDLASANRVASNLADDDLTDALVEVAACFPVYRTYVRDAAVSDDDRPYIERALADARRRGAAADAALDFLGRVLLLDSPDGQRAAWLDFVLRWQQFTGPATAKGLEDTSLYVYNRLLSINDVGADPDGTGTTDGATFHRRNEAMLRRWPHTLNATATHDTKRGEDVRARINVLSELPDEWARCLRRWGELNREHKRSLGGRAAPDANEEVLLYQTLLGAWPLDEAELPAFTERVQAYAVKAAREAKTNTSWRDPNAEHERALTEFIAAVLAPRSPFLADFLPFQRKVAFHGAVNSLAQTLLKIASPGVPDVYQGTELWDLSLVDPDNRRPVDYSQRVRLLDELAQRAGTPALARDLLESWPDGRIKLFLMSRALAFRREHPALFSDGEYLPIATSGEHRERVVAFARRHERDWALVAVPRLVAALTPEGMFPLDSDVWGDTALSLPEDAPRQWTHVLTGEPLVGERRSLPLASLFAHLPVALLTGA